MRLFLPVLLFSCFCASANDPISPSWQTVIFRFEYAVRTLFVPELSHWDCRPCTSLDAANAQHDIKSPVLLTHNGTLEDMDENTVVKNTTNLETENIEQTRISSADSNPTTERVDSKIEHQSGMISPHREIMKSACVGFYMEPLSYIKATFTQATSVVINGYAILSRTFSRIFASIARSDIGEEKKGSIAIDDGIIDDTRSDVHLWSDLLSCLEDTYIQNKATLIAFYVNMMQTVKNLLHSIAKSLFIEKANADGDTGCIKRCYDPTEWTFSSLFWKNEMHGPHLLVASVVSQQRTEDTTHDTTAAIGSGTLRKTWIYLSNMTAITWSYIVEHLGATLTTLLHKVYPPSVTNIPDSDTQVNLHSLWPEWTKRRLSLAGVWAGRAWKTICKYELLLFMSIACLWLLVYLRRERNSECIAVCHANDQASDSNANKSTEESGRCHRIASNANSENDELCRQSACTNSSCIEEARGKANVGHGYEIGDGGSKMLKDPPPYYCDYSKNCDLDEQSASHISERPLLEGHNTSCNISIHDLMFIAQPCSAIETKGVMPQAISSITTEQLLANPRADLQEQCNNKIRGFRDIASSIDSSNLRGDAVLGILLKDIGAFSHDRGDCEQVNRNSGCNDDELSENECNTLTEESCDIRECLLVNNKDSTNNSIRDPVFAIAPDTAMEKERLIPTQNDRSTRSETLTKSQLDSHIQCSIKPGPLNMLSSLPGQYLHNGTVVESARSPSNLSTSEINGITRKSSGNEHNLDERRMRHKRSGRIKLNYNCLDSQEHVRTKIPNIKDLDVQIWKGESCRYTEIKPLRGTFGHIFIVKTSSRRRKLVYVLKMSKERHNRDFSPAGDVRLEIMMVRHLRHPNILTCVDVDCERSNFFVSRYFDNRDLHRFYKHHHLPCYVLQYRIIHGLASAVDYIHAMHYAHRSIQPEHVLLDGRLEPRLCGFGFASYCLNKAAAPFQMRGRFGPLAYSPTETFGMANHDPQKADMFSLGATFFYTLRGKNVFKGKLFFEGTGKRPQSESWKSSDNIWCLHLIQHMTSNQPENRPNAKEVLQLVQQNILSVSQKH